jgi:hypothetical protein
LVGVIKQQLSNMSSTECIVEIWKDIPNWNNYQASSYGKIRSKDRRVQYKKVYSRFYESRILKGWLQEGYYFVELNEDGRCKQLAVHTIICETFYGPRPEGYVCRHLNDIKIDNHVKNLCWGTQKENVHDAIKNNLWNNHYYTYNSKDLTLQVIKEIRESKETQRVLAKRYKISQPMVCYIKTGKAWSHL